MKSNIRNLLAKSQDQLHSCGKSLKKVAKDKKLQENVREMLVRKGQEWLEYTEKHILSLAEESRSIRIGGASSLNATNTTSIPHNASSQREIRKQRRERRNRAGPGNSNTNNNLSMGDFTLEDMGQETDQEKAFAMEVAQARKEEDELLMLISQGLEELQDLALTLNKLLKKTSQSIDVASVQMDTTQENIDNVNVQLDRLLESTGKWRFSACACVYYYIYLYLYIISQEGLLDGVLYVLLLYLYYHVLDLLFPK